MPGSGRPTWHLVTCEFPPRLGGVADFTRVAAGVLSREGPVHVWAPAPARAACEGVVVHELESGFSAASLRTLDARLGACEPPRRLFVQWVPHGYGYKSLNVPFCLWVGRRARRGDQIDLMIHEPFLPFDRRRPRQNVGAVAHRLMLRLLLGAATRVWVSTPSFIPDVHRFAPRPVTAAWLPVPSPISLLDAPDEVRRLRASLAGDAPVVGHFGTCNALVAPILMETLERLSILRPELRLIVVGRDTDAVTRALVARGRVAPERIVRSGEQTGQNLSLLLQCCDVFVQPYHDGVSARRTTLMALLQHGGVIVTARGPRTEDDWASSAAVRVLPAADAALFASAAHDLVADPEARMQIADRARELYAKRFDARHLRAALAAGIEDREALPDVMRSPRMPGVLAPSQREDEGSSPAG